MKKELEKRITTSILLVLLVIFCIFINWTIYFLSILLISIISLVEINNLNLKIVKQYSFKKEKKKLIYYYLLSSMYIFFIFMTSTIALYESGSIFVFYILLICIFSDVGGYVIGKTVGGKKLTKISPNKTISGSIGSFFFSIIPLLIFNNFDQYQYSNSITNFAFCLKLSLVCQLGDIFISYLKRKAKVKDTGSFLPGHGGLLDRIDGIIFGIPFAYFSLFGLNGYINFLTTLLSKLK